MKYWSSFSLSLGVGGCQQCTWSRRAEVWGVGYGVWLAEPVEPCLSFGLGYGGVCLRLPWLSPHLEFSPFLLLGASPSHSWLCRLRLDRLSHPPNTVQVILDGMANG